MLQMINRFLIWSNLCALECSCGSEDLTFVITMYKGSAGFCSLKQTACSIKCMRCGKESDRTMKYNKRAAIRLWNMNLSHSRRVDKNKAVYVKDFEVKWIRN